MLKAMKIRLNVSEQDAATLEMMQGKCRGLYNWWVMKLRAGECWRCMEAKKSLAESRKFDPDIDQVYGKLLAEVYFRLDKAMQAFFKRVQNGETVATPGPFAQTDEHLEGYFQLDCKTLDEAIGWAAKMPYAKGGSVEIRPMISYTER